MKGRDKLASLQTQNNQETNREQFHEMSEVKTATYETYRDHIRYIKNESTEFHNIKSQKGSAYRNGTIL